jgi:hypothetical protein
LSEVCVGGDQREVMFPGEGEDVFVGCRTEVVVANVFDLVACVGE